MLSIAESNSIVTDNLKEIIKEKNLKQSFVANKSGFSAQELNDMLNGRRLIRAVDIVAILNVLRKEGVDANRLFKRGDK